MADGKVKFEADVDSKQAMKELASLEKEFKKQEKVLNGLEAKYNELHTAREKALLGGSTISEENQKILNLISKNEKLKKEYESLQHIINGASDAMRKLY